MNFIIENNYPNIWIVVYLTEKGEHAIVLLKY